MATVINGSAGVTTNSGAVYNSIQTATSVTASGTSVIFTGIPSWAKKVTLICANLSTNGASDCTVRIGPSSGVVSTGYTAAHGTVTGTNTSTTSNATTSFYFASITAASNVCNGALTLYNISGNTWVASSICTSSSPNARMATGSITLAGALNTISLTTTSGTDAFDAGTVNVFYE